MISGRTGHGARREGRVGSVLRASPWDRPGFIPVGPAAELRRPREQDECLGAQLVARQRRQLGRVLAIGGVLAEQVVGLGLDDRFELFDRDAPEAGPKLRERPRPRPRRRAVGRIVRFGAVLIEQLDRGGDRAAPVGEGATLRPADELVLELDDLVADPRVRRPGDDPDVIAGDPPLQPRPIRHLQVTREDAGQAHLRAGGSRGQLGLAGEPRRGLRPVDQVGVPGLVQHPQRVDLEAIQQLPGATDFDRQPAQIRTGHRGEVQVGQVADLGADVAELVDLDHPTIILGGCDIGRAESAPERKKPQNDC